MFDHSWRFYIENNIAFFINSWDYYGWLASKLKSCWIAYLGLPSFLLRIYVTSLIKSLLICYFIQI